RIPGHSSVRSPVGAAVACAAVARAAVGGGRSAVAVVLAARGARPCAVLRCAVLAVPAIVAGRDAREAAVLRQVAAGLRRVGAVRVAEALDAGAGVLLAQPAVAAAVPRRAARHARLLRPAQLT